MWFRGMVVPSVWLLLLGFSMVLLWCACSMVQLSLEGVVVPWYGCDYMLWFQGVVFVIYDVVPWYGCCCLLWFHGVIVDILFHGMASSVCGCSMV